MVRCSALISPRNWTLAVTVCITLLAFKPNVVAAAESGLTNYLAGFYGDFGVAVAARPGTYVYNTSYAYSARTEGPKLPGRSSLDGLINLTGFQVVTSQTFFGARYGFGGYMTVIAANLEAQIPTAAGELHITDNTSGLGDTSFSPISLFWSQENWHVNFYQAVIAPTGRYDVTAPLNVSRNYFSFDSVLALTWLDPVKGIEFSIVPGMMFNTTNPSTDYKTGSEFHIDAMLNLALSKSIAVGLHGYAYSQMESDSGQGAMIKDLRASSAAIGPSFLWTPAFLEGGKIVGKWLHEFHAKNRFRGDIVSLTGVVRF